MNDSSRGLYDTQVLDFAARERAAAENAAVPSEDATGMKESPTAHGRMLLIAAVASLLSAATTAILIYGPAAPLPPDAVSQAQLHSSWLHLYKKWVLFVHPQFAFIASLGIGFALFARRPVCISIGLFYLGVWAVTEMTQQAFIIDGLNQYWRPGLLNADNEADRAAYETLLKGFAGFSDSQYFVLLFSFGVGTTLFGIAMLGVDVFGKAIGAVLIGIGLLSLTAFAGYYLGLSLLTPFTSWLYSNVYGIVQTGVRIAIGIWLWRLFARQSSA